MPVIPLPFVVALLLAILLVRMALRGEEERVDRASMIFVAACAGMVMVVGLRWSVDLTAMRFIQPVVAATLPPIAWVCFAGLAPGAQTRRLPWLHALPVGLVAVLATGWLPWPAPTVDLVIAALFFGYGMALLKLGSNGPDGLGAARFTDATMA